MTSCTAIRGLTFTCRCSHLQNSFLQLGTQFVIHPHTRMPPMYPNFWHCYFTAYVLCLINVLKFQECAKTIYLLRYITCLQCFDTVGRQERHPACKKTEWQGAGVVICLELGVDLQVAQLMPLPLTVSCFSKIQIGFTFLVPAHLGSPGQRAVKRVQCSSIYSDVLNTIQLFSDSRVMANSPTFVLAQVQLICNCLFCIKKMTKLTAPKIWNSLPLSLRTCTSPDTFRRHLKTHYCQQAFHST